jgi:hypothetical protein
MPYQPVLNPYPAQAISRGFDTISAALRQRAEQEQQQEQFAADLKERAAYHRGVLASQADDRGLGYYRAGIEEQLGWARLDPNRVQPVALLNPATGQPIPGQYAIPMTGQLLQAPTGQPQDRPNYSSVLDERGNRVGYWTRDPFSQDGKGKFIAEKPEGDTDSPQSYEPEAGVRGVPLSPQERIDQLNAAIAANPAAANQVHKDRLGRSYDLPGETRQQALARLQRQLTGGGQARPRIPANAEPVRRAPSSPAPARKPATSTPRPTAKAPAVEPPLPEPDAPDFPTPPPAAIDHLLAHPELALDFEAKYGPGTSESYLPRR